MSCSIFIELKTMPTKHAKRTEVRRNPFILVGLNPKKINKICHHYFLVKFPTQAEEYKNRTRKLMYGTADLPVKRNQFNLHHVLPICMSYLTACHSNDNDIYNQTLIRTKCQ